MHGTRDGPDCCSGEASELHSCSAYAAADGGGTFTSFAAAVAPSDRLAGTDTVSDTHADAAAVAHAHVLSKPRAVEQSDSKPTTHMANPC